jgi:hypothetical protein
MGAALLLSARPRLSIGADCCRTIEEGPQGWFFFPIFFCKNLIFQHIIIFRRCRRGWMPSPRGCQGRHAWRTVTATSVLNQWYRLKCFVFRFFPRSCACHNIKFQRSVCTLMGLVEADGSIVHEREISKTIDDYLWIKVFVLSCFFYIFSFHATIF